MKPTFCFSRLSVIYFFISLARSTITIQHTPLIFDPYTLQVYNPESGLSYKSPKYPFAVACPAVEKDEKYLNDHESFDHKALFVRKYYGEGNFFPIRIEDCATSIQLSAVSFRENNMDEIKFGYEIYDDKKLPEDAHKSDYESYGPVSESSSIMKFIFNAIKQNLYPTIGYDRVGFTWITKILARYHVGTWKVFQIQYQIYRNAFQVNVDCTDDNLAKKIYRKRLLDDYYSPDNQTKVFSSVKLPEPVEGDALESTYKQVKKYSLLFPYNFQATSSSPVSCSDLTTVPIWYRKTEALLNYLEHFLIAIGQITMNPLTILSGVYDVVTLPSTKGTKPKPVKMYLDSGKKRIPIPRIIYKIIRYRSYDCDSEEDLCWFDVVIFIHNHPNITKPHELCLKDKCEEWGWGRIQHMNTTKKSEKSEHIYCCGFDERLRKIIGYKKDNNLSENFNLREFPRYEKTIKDHEYTNRQKEFEQQMDMLILRSKFFQNLNQ